MSVLGSIFGRGNVTYHVAVAEALDSIAAAIFAEQIAFWQHRSPDGWVYRTQEQIQEYTALKRRPQDTARKHLKELGLLQEKRKAQNRLHYHLDLQALEALVLSGPAVVHNVQTDVRNVRSVVRNGQTHKEGVEREERETLEGDASASAPEFVAQLDERLTDSTVTLTASRKARYGREFKEALRKGRKPEELDEVIDRIVERWEEYQLSVEQAMRDLQNGRTPGTGAPSGNKGDGIVRGPGSSAYYADLPGPEPDDLDRQIMEKLQKEGPR